MRRVACGADTPRAAVSAVAVAVAVASLVSVSRVAGTAAVIPIGGRGLGEKAGESAPEEEPRLGGEADPVQARPVARPGKGTEVHARGDVLKGGEDERVVVPAVAVVAPEGAAKPFRVVVLGLSVAVVEDEHEPPVEAARDRFEPAPEGRTPLRLVAGRPDRAPEPRLDGPDVVAERAAGRPGHPTEPPGVEADVQRLHSLRGDAKSFDGERVRYFVREDDAGERLTRQRVQPLHPEPLEAPPLPFPEVGTRLEDPVPGRGGVPARELPEAALRERSGSASELEDLASAEKVEDLPERPGDRAPEQGRDLGGGHEVPSRPELP